MTLTETTCKDCRYEVRGEPGHNETIHILMCSLHANAEKMRDALRDMLNLGQMSLPERRVVVEAVHNLLSDVEEGTSGASSPTTYGKETYKGVSK